MHLNSDHLVHYLLDRGLIEPASAVDGGLRVEDTSRRHRSYRVLADDRRLFIKQSADQQPQTTMTLQREGACYWLAAHEPEFAALQALTPNFVDYDQDAQLLVVELIDDAENLSEAYQRRGSYPAAVASALGERLGTYHRQQQSAPADGELSALFTGSKPWPLQLHRLPMDHFARFGAAGHQLVVTARQDQLLVDHLRAAGDAWQVSTLIHGDVKWDNVLCRWPSGDDTSSDDTSSDGTKSDGTSSDETSDDAVDIRLIDWELADRGDPLWDAGGVLQAYLVHWLWSMPVEQGLPPEQLVAAAQAPIETMQPSVQAFWQNYVAARQLSEEQADDALLQSLRFAAGRLVQTAFERSVAVGAVDAKSTFLLRAAVNVLSHPANTRRQLAL